MVQLTIGNRFYLKHSVLALIIALTPQLHGDQEGPVAPAVMQITPDQIVVKVHTTIGSPFSGELSSQGHGTAFVNEINRETGIVTLFTNRHVVEKPTFQAQSLQVAVTNSSGMPEMAKAKVVYESPLFDFAVLEVKLSDLPQTGAKLRAVRLPGDDNPFFNFVKNLHTMQGGKNQS